MKLSPKKVFSPEIIIVVITRTYPIPFAVQKEGTVLLLADILCACYGWEPVPRVEQATAAAAVATSSPHARVDPAYVNNPELADVTFRYLRCVQ